MIAEGIALCRISSVGQDAGHSLDAQEKSTISMSKEMGVGLARNWSITQSSKAGKNRGRKDLIEIKVYCRKNRNIKYLFVDRVNRLMREWKMMLVYMIELEELGVKVIFCDPSQRHLNSDDQMSQLLLIIEGFKSEQENKERAETTIARMKSRYNEGYYLSHPHPGYIKSGTPGLHIPDPQRFSLLQQGGRLIIYNQYTVQQAVRWINDNGYRTIGGKKLDTNHFVDFISDRYYCGYIDIKSADWPKNVNGLHERMFTPREHQILLSVITKRNPQVRRKHNPEFPMANILRHLECRGNGHYEKFAGHNHNRGQRPNGRKRPLQPVYDCRDCRKRLSRDDVHQSISKYLDALVFMPEEKRFKKALTLVWKRQRGSVTQRLAVLRTKKAKIEQKAKETAISYASESLGVAKQALRSLLEDYHAELQLIDTDINNALHTEIESEDFVRFALDFVETLKKKWWSMSFENRQRGEQILFNGKLYADNSAKVHTPSLSTIYRLGTNKKALSGLDNAHLVELPGTAPGSASLSLLAVYRCSLLEILTKRC